MRRNTNVFLISVMLINHWLVNDACSQGKEPRAAWTTSNLRGQPTPPDPYKVELAFPKLKFENPKCVVEIPGTDRLLVAHAGTKLVSFTKGKDTETTSLVADLEGIEGEFAGPNTVAFHPDFINNRYIFVAMSHAAGGFHSRVMRYTLTDETASRVIPDSGRFIIRWPAGGHGGGCLDFGKDGYLYISTGDGSGPSPPDLLTTGQDISDLLGAVLRIDVDHATDDQNYAVPADNPFVGLANARPEIWSYGLRNPWKFGIDRKSGDIFVADNGWETWEMIHKLHRGSNCGWPIMEGRAKLRTEVEQGPTPITPPLKDHPHTEANSVIGGPVYRGQAFPDLYGWFVYGDYITGTIWALKSGASGEFEHRTLSDSDLHIVAFTEGSGGEIYLLDYDTTGQLYLLKRSDEVDTSATFPRRLSQTGLFADMDSLTPAEGVVPYRITAEAWSDGATARRWAAIPGSASIKFDSGHSSAAQFPDGSVLVKHLFMPQREHPLETQLLHYQNGSWNPYSYLWDESGSDATLVDPQGVDREIQPTDDPKSKRTWHIGSTNECRLCHNAGSGVVLGFTARQLQGGAVNQLDQLVDAEDLAQLSEISRENRLVDPHDETADINDRARSYLHMNCGICHNRQGPATISFYAHRDYDFADLRITKQPGIGSFGMKSPQLISPGNPYSSIILYRLAKLGYGRMPYVGSRVVDGQGVLLINEWIKSLTDVDGYEPETDNVDELLTTTEGGLALATRMHRGNVSHAELSRVFQATEQKSGDIRGLFDHFLPESERRQTLGMNPDLATVLSIKGNPARGELIFLSDNARCKSCHDLRDADRSFGPTLSEIRKQFERRGEMLTHIVRPSEKINEKFVAWNVILNDGRNFVGLLASKDDREVVLRTADKKMVRINRGDIETMQASERSMMPEGVLSDLAPQAAADLLAYLMQK